MTDGGFVVRMNGTVHTGHAVDIEAEVDPGALGDSVGGDGPFDVRCPSPGAVHEYVGVVTPSRSVSVRSALAAAARSRGMTAPVDDDIDRLDRQLAEIETTADQEPAIRDAQRRVAERLERERVLRERVQTLHGRLRGLRERDEPTANTEDALAAATESLAEVETERIAAEERLQQHRQAVRERRDRRERRLRLQDERDNLARTARRHLAEAVYDDFADAVAAVPGEGRAGNGPGEYEGDRTTATLAVARIAEVRAPIVLACGRFPGAAAAAECLGAPVIRVDPNRDRGGTISRREAKPR